MSQPMPIPFDLQGHRGARGLWPENTLEGIRRTLALGVTSIEIDAVVTADGVAMVCHDLHLNPNLVRDGQGRWLGKPTPAIASLTAAELAAFDVGRLKPRTRYSARFPRQTVIDGASIPRLAEICAFMGGTGVRLDIEIKPGAAPDRATDAVLAATEHAGGAMISFRSFDWRVLRRVRALRPDAPIAWLTGRLAPAGPDLVIADIMRGGWPQWAPVWAPDHRSLRKRHIVAAHAAGLRVVPWTVNGPKAMARLIGWDVDGLCTDRPDIALGVVEERREFFLKKEPKIFPA